MRAVYFTFLAAASAIALTLGVGGCVARLDQQISGRVEAGLVPARDSRTMLADGGVQDSQTIADGHQQTDLSRDGPIDPLGPIEEFLLWTPDESFFLFTDQAREGRRDVGRLRLRCLGKQVCGAAFDPQPRQEFCLRDWAMGRRALFFHRG